MKNKGTYEYLEKLGKQESSGRYNAINPLGYIGILIKK